MEEWAEDMQIPGDGHPRSPSRSQEMCFTNTAFSIKLLSAFCFCVNTFNVIYLFMRHHDLLPDEMKALRRAVEKVLPDVKNLDKY
ncbi:hypothetical protein HPB47_013840, partial [Ixodes persulcatus]